MKLAVAALAIALVAGAAAPAEAQLYRWRDPESGSVKFSSLPPPWFIRGVSQGPHVEVLVNGKLVDPAVLARAATGAGTAGAAAPPGPLPPPRIALPPADATKEQLVDAVLGGMGLRDQFASWSAGVGLGLEQALGKGSVPEATRETIRTVARSAYRTDRLYAHFTKAFAAEMTEADLRGLIDAEQTPIGRRAAGLESARAKQTTFDPQALQAAEARASAERRALAEELERTVQGAELMSGGLAGVGAALALASPGESRTRIAETLQRQKAEMMPVLRRTFVQSALLIYEPLSDAEFRALIDLQRRPAVLRANRAVAVALAATVQESLAEFIAGVRPVAAELRR